ncbi:AfsA-related hotdog domain-containing protein [Ottowia testudinis]|uniref:A-factor biosynthesis hotdog domain-containing protein n=1 Tax=Ottowia testudinis TaxID=2816950 RepID=A0A975CE64_9BURK|nr:AfsA-related hotdog domain-containing protein [Ottowia testudinis]QTD44121.1 hypothetical protein J1M35_13385 [Ottowia testudinis]
MTDILPKLLHKNSADDVLLANPRPVLPTYIGAQSAAAINGAQHGIAQLYKRQACGGYLLNHPPLDRTYAGIPFSQLMDTAASRLARGVPHQVMAQLWPSCRMDEIQESRSQDTLVEEFLARCLIPRRSSSFSFINQADHYFFYRKPHEHVPGIMLLEAARQTIYYQLYTHSAHKLGDVTVSLSELNSKFQAYAELMYPIEIVVDDLTEGDSLRPRVVRYVSSFFQRGALIAEIESVAPVVGLDKFKAARNACLLHDERFEPLANAPVVTLFTAGGKQEIVRLKEVGSSSCVMSLPKVEDANQGELTLLYEGNICFHTKIKRVSVQSSSTAWSFADTSYRQLENLKEIIKRGFVQVASRNPSAAMGV